jgi:hypothetical protein
VKRERKIWIRTSAGDFLTGVSRGILPLIFLRIFTAYFAFSAGVVKLSSPLFYRVNLPYLLLFSQ